MSNVTEFLHTLFDKDVEDDGPVLYLCIGTKAQGAALTSNWFAWPEEEQEIQEASDNLDCDLYFIPKLFTARDIESTIAPTSVLAVDMDRTDLVIAGLTPTLVVETSPGRHQCYWLLGAPIDPDTASVLARNLCYSVTEADRLTWHNTAYFRLPYSTSYKRLEPYAVLPIQSKGKRYDAADLELLPDASGTFTTEQLDFINNPPSKEDATHGPAGIIQRALKEHKIGARAATSYDIRLPKGQDRVRHMWTLLTEVLGHGMDRRDAYFLGLFSPNNPYADLQYHGERELAKDVIRAEVLAHTRTRNVREMVNEARRTLQGPQNEKMQQLQTLVMDHMRSDGEFLATNEGVGYYVSKTRGRPVPIVGHSGPINALLDMQFGLNATEHESKYIVSGLETHIQQLPANGVEAALSYYDGYNNTLYLHGGRRDVYRIATDRVDRIVDGSDGIVFPWPMAVDAFNPQTSELPDGKPWWEIMFSEVLDNVTVLTRDQAVALITTWFLSLIFRTKFQAKPILLLQGQPGSGKTAMFARVFALLYGRGRSIGAITTPANFDHASINDALAVFDNVDTSVSWLPDRLAQASKNTDVPVRKLYSNLETVLLQRKAFIGLTSHNPNFSRADVADRLIILTLERIENFLPEALLLERVFLYRHQLWGAIIRTVQEILATPQPRSDEAPYFRVQDFSFHGLWFARAIGMEQAFRGAMDELTQSQKRFALADEGMLLVAMKRLVERRNNDTGYLKPTALFQDLSMVSDDEQAFIRTYKSAASFSRHLVGLIQPLSGIINLKRKPVPGGFDWRIWLPEAKNTRDLCAIDSLSIEGLPQEMLTTDGG